ncbi:hypothetical protein [Nocardioides sp.]|uniref:hypothetical protein n=1 Tax=Nocardioides sp. TaxID=35761 RepID=UPI0035665FCC
MRPMRTRYVAACQHLLAFGVVVVAMVPATGVISLDVVGVDPAPAIVPVQPLPRGGVGELAPGPLVGPETTYADVCGPGGPGRLRCG